jgi:hypothetical protein
MRESSKCSMDYAELIRLGFVLGEERAGWRGRLLFPYSGRNETRFNRAKKFNG